MKPNSINLIKFFIIIIIGIILESIMGYLILRYSFEITEKILLYKYLL